MKLAFTMEERQRLLAQGVIRESVERPPGRPRKSSFADEKPVCKARGCFNYVEHRDDACCRQCDARTTLR